MLRCSSLEYARYAPFTRLAHDADVSPRAAPLFFNGLLGPVNTEAKAQIMLRRLRGEGTPLGGPAYADQRVEAPADAGAAILRAKEATAHGEAALLEFITSEETEFSHRRAFS